MFYEVQTANCRVQIMGSMNLDGKTEYPVGADLLVLPFQGRSDQDRYALQFIERLRPKAVVLDHYDDSFPPLTVQIDTGDFQKTVEERYGISCTPLTKHRTIDV